MPILPKPGAISGDHKKDLSPDAPNHEGRNIKRFREMLGIKQAALAAELGGRWNQKKISQLEKRETVDPLVLERIAKLFRAPADIVRRFDEETATRYASGKTPVFVEAGVAGEPVEERISVALGELGQAIGLLRAVDEHMLSMKKTLEGNGDVRR